MKTITILAATALTFGSVTAHAEESVVERAVGQFVEHAVTLTKAELSAKLQHSISSSAFNFSLEENYVKGKVEITELAALPLSKQEHTAKRN
ncbi:hypothetical protein OPS25_14045 [Alteromonas ponticola]|uniref:Uncharacterized protein n=1 Tax=Alteromonas aquimaris TaxID=2998417 RepID=A0ABT3PA22_9ALTE|nr:hypothetical protein [Alteromonas aquimaris]MCW8109627.1 hypothetical protein [Alteromonas aquimaris]